MFINPESIDYSKYKRLFTFGCSFTNYSYPTWANIIQKNMPNAEFHNFGACGAGNLFISNRITEVNHKFKFNETDLVLVMWSTHCREDRFVGRDWNIPGNIFTQGEYSKDFVKNYCDPIGYLIKDMSIIDLTTSYLNSLYCSTFQMFSVDAKYQHEADEVELRDSVIETYKELIELFGESMIEFIKEWPSHVKYYDHYSDRMVYEYHPTPKQYYQYLESKGFKLSIETEAYALDADEFLTNVSTLKELEEYFKIAQARGIRNWI